MDVTKMTEDQVVRQFEALVWHVAKPMHRQWRKMLDFDDVLQVGRMAVLSARRAWRIDRGASFKSYAYVCVRNAVQSHITHSLKPYRNVGRIDSLSARDGAGDLLSDAPDDGAACPLVAAERGELCELVRAAIHELPPTRDKEMLRGMVLAGRTAKEVGDAIGVHPNTVRETATVMVGRLVARFQETNPAVFLRAS